MKRTIPPQPGRSVRTFSLKTYLFCASLLLVTVSLVLVSYFSYQTTVSAVLDQTAKMDESNLKQVNNKIVFAIGEIEKLTRNFAGNEELGDNLRRFGDSHTVYDRLEAEARLRGMLNEMKVGYEDVQRVEIYTPGGAVSTDKAMQVVGPYTASAIYRTIRDTETNVHIFAPNTRDDLTGIGYPNFMFGTILHDGEAESGMMLVIMSPVWMERMFREENVLIASRQSLLWRSDARRTAGNEPLSLHIAYDQGDFKEKLGKEDTQFFYMKSRYNDWYTVTFKSLQEIYGPINTIRQNVFIAVLMSSVISFILVYSVARSIVRPLHRLKGSAQKYKAEEIFDYAHSNGRGMRMRKIVMLYFVAVITIPLSIYIVMFHHFSSQVIEDKVKSSFIQTFAQTASNIDAFIATNERISTNIMTDPNVQRFLAADSPAAASSMPEQIGRTIDTNLSLGDNIFETSLFDRQHRQLFSTSYFTNKQLLDDRADEYAGKPFWIGYDVDPYNRNVVRLVRQVRGVRDDEQFLHALGFLQTTYYESNLESLYREVNAANVYLTDQSGTIISHPAKSLIGTQSVYRFPDQPARTEAQLQKRNGRNYLVVAARCARIPWIVVGELDYEIVKRDSRNVLQSNLWSMALIVLAAVAISYVLAQRLTQSIVKLQKKLRLFADGYMQVRFDDSSNISEIHELALAFQDMAGRIGELIDSIYKSVAKEKALENEKKEAELIALHAQINPHFLYNTLESIKWMMKGGKADKADDMISALASLFRLGVQRENRLVTIEQEIGYAQAYINIQKVRLGDKVNFWWSVDPQVSAYLTPKLILQPVIENAIVHGIVNKEEGGNISIYCYAEDGNIVFKVMDDGAGLPSAGNVPVEALRSGAGGTGIGLANVQKRIKLYYGDAYGVSVASNAGFGTRVTIVIPQITPEA
ncbi:MAG: sensor histidine kinase [Paenibacillaceae bacterium]|nr:sensor histidine kinase [Paenibacillaceae bacterium]